MVPSHCSLSPWYCFFLFLCTFHLWLFFSLIFYWTFFWLFVFILLMLIFIPLSLHLPTMNALFSFLPFSYFVFLLGALEWLLCRTSPSLSSILSELPPFIPRYGAWVHMSPALENYQKWTPHQVVWEGGSLETCPFLMLNQSDWGLDPKFTIYHSFHLGHILNICCPVFSSVHWKWKDAP